MSLVVATAVADGIVIAADSRLTSWNFEVGGQPRIATEYEHKLFEVRGMAIGTAGCSKLMERSIEDHIGEFEKTLPPRPSMDEVLTGLIQYFDAVRTTHVANIQAVPTAVDAKSAANSLRQREAARIFFLVAGFDGERPRIDRIVVTEPHPEFAPCGYAHFSTFKNGVYGVEFIGMVDVAERLIHGYSATLVKKVPADVDKRIKQTTTNIPFASWKIQDALNFVWTLFYVTMYMQRISISRESMGMEHPTVGGEIEYIIIKKSGLKWEQRKQTALRPTIPDPPQIGD